MFFLNFYMVKGENWFFFKKVAISYLNITKKRVIICLHNIIKSSRSVSMSKISILFIGNSFTFYNDMPNSIFKDICEEAGLSVNVNSITCGGYKLSQFADPENEFGKKVIEAFENNRYNIVVLQEQSRNPILNFDEFSFAVEKLHNMAKENGADVYLYQTWGYKAGHSLLPICGNSMEDMGEKLKSAYCSVGEKLNCKIAHVGSAFTDIYKNTDIDLYKEDLFHPSKSGSILAAWVIFSTIFGISPENVNFDCTISKEESDILKSAAKNALNA